MRNRARFFRRWLPLALTWLFGPVPGLAAEPGAPSRPVLVTVDDLPISSGRLHPDPAERERITRGLLAALEKHRIRAVGLVTWANVTSEADRRLLELWLEAGHELGNHSHRHLNYTATETQAYVADVEEARKQIAGLLQPHGRTPRFFRFPFLREGDTPEKLETMRAYLETTGQRNLPVTIDNQDWSYEEPWVEARRKGDAAALKRLGGEYRASILMAAAYYERLGEELFGRPVPQILLLHANEVGEAQWDELFTALAQAGHGFTGADQALGDPAFSTPHRYVGAFGPSLWERIADERPKEKARADVRKLLDEQTAAWNRGDLDAFCAGYAEDAAFLSPSGLTKGRAAVLERYRKRYPDRSSLGALSLEVTEMRLYSGLEDSPLGNAQPSRVHAASVAARWTLSYPDKEPATGLTLIVLQRRQGRWQIVQDASM
jgi:uncharacterized protein (TIGR02246 family)